MFWCRLTSVSVVCVYECTLECTYILHTRTLGSPNKFIQVSLIHYVCDLFPFFEPKRSILITRYCALSVVDVRFTFCHSLGFRSVTHIFTYQSRLFNRFNREIVAFFFIYFCFRVNVETSNFQLLLDKKKSIKLTNHRLLTQEYPMKIIIGHPL